MDIAGELDQLRIALGEVNILATLTKAAYDNAEWDGPDPDIVDGIASLLGLISKSAVEAMAAFHVLHAAVADAQPAPATVATERWDYDRARHRARACPPRTRRSSGASARGAPTTASTAAPTTS